MSAAKANRLDRYRHWSQMAALAVERLPWPYLWTVAPLWLLGLGEQLLEEYYLDPTFQTIWLRIGRRMGLLGLAIYTPVMLKLLRLQVVKAALELRPSVLVTDQIYDRRVCKMLGENKRGEWVLLGLSIVTVLLWFVVLRYAFPIVGLRRLYLPGYVLPAALMLVTYSLMGWALLVLLYSTLQLGIGLSQLARDPLAVNVYDPVHLLPFGHLAMLYSLSVAGVVLIMILSFGQPTDPLDYVAIGLLSLASVLALVLPIWGVYVQMYSARIAALSEIHARLRMIHGTLVSDAELPAPEVAALTNQTAALVNLRKVIQESPRWPFRSEAAIARALLAALTPLIYFVLNEVVRAYALPYLTGRH